MPKPRDTSGVASAAVLTIETNARRAEALAARLEARWQHPPVIVQRPFADRAWIDLYFDRDIEAFLAAVAIRNWPGVRAAQPRVCRQRDWQSFWRDHFKIRDVGRRLRIQPVWEKRAALPKGRKRIWLDPGLSFGTGEHFTTRFCLEQIDRLSAGGRARSVLDVGTGSGILAIAAARLGVPRVVAIDYDPQAVAQARANARLNRIGTRVRFAVRDFAAKGLPKGRFDLVCANVYSRLLTDAAPALARAARAHVVLSGIREAELDGVADAYLALGMRETVRDGDGEWGGLVFSWIRSSST
jgi:ribosomal protein L11 methyltransferase